jgi:hypothetical protein
MKPRIAVALAALCAAAALSPGQDVLEQRQPNQQQERHDIGLPNGKRQSDEILKEEHKKNLEDAAELVRLSESLKAELEKSDAFVLSLAAIKKTEAIEKIAKRIRSRLKR